jgi:hypothetical protein
MVSDEARRRIRVGNALTWAGILGLPLGVGAAAGFWISDFGARWLPTMVEILIGVAVLSTVVLFAGHALKGKWSRETPQGARVRKRTAATFAMAILAGLAQLFVFWTTQTRSALTELDEEVWEEVYAHDVAQYAEHEAALERILGYLRTHPALSEDPERVLSADEENDLRHTWVAFYHHAHALDQLRVFYEDWYRFDPSRHGRRFHVRSFMLTFAAELALFEKAARMVNTLGKNRNAVKFINAPDATTGLPENSYSFLEQELLGARDQGRILAGRNYHLFLTTGFRAARLMRRMNLAWLNSHVDGHLRRIDDLGVIAQARLLATGDTQLFRRSVRRVWFPTQTLVAEWMGDTRVRRIHEYLISVEQQEKLDEMLAPGDVLLARKNWYLSNIGLPGFWPHAILYLGAPDKFASYFADPDVVAWVKTRGEASGSLQALLEKKYPEEWRAYQSGDHGDPFRVMEAVSEGVVFSTLAHCAGDYLVALRPKLSKVAKAQAVWSAFAYLGRPYDFDFDFATDHALVCTELVWRAYRPADGKAGLEVELTEMMGRKTLPAHNFAKAYAKMAGKEDAALEFVAFIDAQEREGRAFFSTEEAFIKTAKRTKWDVALK